MRQDICKHFIGHGMPTHCAAGVCYRDVTPQPDEPGTALREPCRAASSWSSEGMRAKAAAMEQGTCDKREFPTDEECAASEKEMEAFMDRLRLITPVISELKKKHRGKGFSGVIECPSCNGKMHVSIASSNGHARVQCETKGCCQFIE